MADYDTGKDIAEDMASRAGELELDAAELEAEIKRYANRGYFGVLRVFPWLYNEAYPPRSIVTQTKIALTGVVVTNGVTTVTVTESLSPTLTGKFVLDRDGLPMRISSVFGSVITLDAGYVGDSGTGLTGYVFQDEYQTPDVLVATRIKNISKPSAKITIMGHEEMDYRFVTSLPFGIISAASFYTEDVLRLARIPETSQLLEMHYSKRPPRLTFTGGVDDIPVLPHDERWLIADYGLYFLLVDHDEEGAAEVARIAAGRIGEAKDRQIAKMSPRVWLPDAFNLSVSG